MQCLDPFSTFAIVGLKNHFLPYVYSVVLGNHLSTPSSGSILSQKQQIVAFIAVFMYSVVDGVGKASSKPGVERQVDSRGRPKDG